MYAGMYVRTTTHLSLVRNLCIYTNRTIYATVYVGT